MRKVISQPDSRHDDFVLQPVGGIFLNSTIHLTTYYEYLICESRNSFPKNPNKSRVNYIETNHASIYILFI